MTTDATLVQDAFYAFVAGTNTYTVVFDLSTQQSCNTVLSCSGCALSAPSLPNPIVASQISAVYDESVLPRIFTLVYSGPVLAAGTYEFIFILTDSAGQTLNLIVQMNVVNYLFWEQWSGGTTISPAANPVFQFSTTYSALTSPSFPYSTTIDLSNNSVAQAGYNLIYPLANIIVADVVTATFNSGWLTFTTNLAPSCSTPSSTQKVQTQITLKDTISSMQTTLTIEILLTDACCFSQFGTTILMPTIQNIQFLLGSPTTPPSQSVDLSTVTSTPTVCAGIETTCTSTPTQSSISLVVPALTISYDSSITTAQTIAVTCTASLSPSSGLDLRPVSTSFDVQYVDCSSLTLNAASLAGLSANLYENSLLTWTWREIIGLISNYNSACQLQIVAVSSTIGSTYYSISSALPATSDLGISINLNGVALSTTTPKAGSYSFTLSLKYAAISGNPTPLTAPVTLIDQCKTTTYTFPSYMEIRYNSGLTYTQSFPLLDTYSTTLGRSMCGAVNVQIEQTYLDIYGSYVLRRLNAFTYPQFSNNILSFAENTTFYNDENLNVLWNINNGMTQFGSFTIKVIKCILSRTGLVLSYQVLNAGVPATQTYSLQDLTYSFNYNTHPLCLYPIINFVNCVADVSQYPTANPAAIQSAFDLNTGMLSINIDNTSTKGKYMLNYTVDMACSGVETILQEIWVMIDASSCTLALGNFFPPTSYTQQIVLKTTLVRVGSFTTYNFFTLKQQNAGGDCGWTEQELYDAPGVLNTRLQFQLANQTMSVKEDATICVNPGDTVCLVTIYVRTFLVNQESIAPVEVYDEYYFQFVNCYDSQIYFSVPDIVLSTTSTVAQTLSLEVVSGLPDNQGLLFKVSDPVSDRVANMFCGTYNFTVTSITKKGDSTVTVPTTELVFVPVDKLTLFQVVTFTIEDAYWPFYDNQQTDYYTIYYTWFTTPKNMYYGYLTNPDFAPANVSASFDFQVSRCVVDNYTVAITPNQVFALYAMDILRFTFNVGQQNPNCKHAITQFVATFDNIQPAFYFLDQLLGEVVLSITDTEMNQPIINTIQKLTYRPLFKWTPDLAADSSLDVKIINDCKEFTLSADSQIQNLVYNISSRTVTFPIPTIRDSVSQALKIRHFCGAPEYSILYQDAVSTLPFIWIFGTSVQISTLSQNDVGVYELVIRANIQTYSMNFIDLPFVLTIQKPAVDAALTYSSAKAPVLTKKLENVYYVLWNETLSLQFTVDALPEYEVSFDWSSTSIISHDFETNSQQLSIWIGPFGSLINGTVSSSFSMFLSDLNGQTNYTVFVKFCSTEYYEQVYLAQFNTTSNSSANSTILIYDANKKFHQYAERPSTAKITTISLAGKVVISFSPMIDAIDQAVQIVTNENLLQVKYIRNSYVEQNFNWTVKDFTRSYASIQCFFDAPLAVSQGDYPDQIEVKLSKSILVNHLPHRMLSEDYQTMVAFIPLQERNEEKAAILEQRTNILASTALTVFWLFILLQFFAKKLIKNLWDVFNFLQILLAIPAFRLKFTVTLLAYSKAVEDIINLQIIPKEKIRALIDADGEESYTSKIILLVIMVIVLTILVYFIIKIRRNSFELLPKRCQSLFKLVEDRVMFSALIRILLQSYLATSIATVSQLARSDNRVSWYGSVIMLAYLIGFPYFTYKFQRLFRWKLREPETRQQYGTMYRDQDVYNLPAASWTMLFLYKRLIFAVIIVCVEVSILQVTLLSYLQILTLAYLIRVQPMVDVYSNAIQLLNETSILVCTLLSLAFSDYVEDYDLRMMYGFWFLYIVAATIGLNVLLLLAQYCAKRRRLNAYLKSRKLRVKPKRQVIKKAAKKRNFSYSVSIQSDRGKKQVQIFEEQNFQSDLSQVNLLHSGMNVRDQNQSRQSNEEQVSKSIHIQDSYRPRENSQLSDLISHNKSLHSDHNWAKATQGMPTYFKNLQLADNTLDHQLNDLEDQIRSPQVYKYRESPTPQNKFAAKKPQAQDVLPVLNAAHPDQRQKAPLAGQVQTKQEPPKLVQLQQMPPEQPRPQALKQPVLPQKPKLNDPYQIVTFNYSQGADQKQKPREPSKYSNVVVHFK